MTINLAALIVSGVVGVLFLVFDLWLAGRISKRTGPVRLVLDELERVNATLAAIDAKLGGDR